MKKINKNIFLIGMMGSWKSTVGEKLANYLNYKFIDSDDEIEKITNMSIKDFFKIKSEKEFRTLETAFFLKNVGDSGKVISTGGGIVIDKKNRHALRNNGISILLKATPKTLTNRIKNSNKRPLLNEKNILPILSKLWINRKRFYEDSAHFSISTDSINSTQVVDIIIDRLKTINEKS